MDSMRRAFKGVIHDFKGRLPCYKHDWLEACCGLRILAPTAYIFFASALPVIAFGEQLSRETGIPSGILLFLVAIFNACTIITRFTRVAGELFDMLIAVLFIQEAIKDMGNVPVAYIFVAVIPAVMISGLYLFDHSVAAQMAQQKEYNLKNPSTYHYDLLLLGFMTLICGLLGLPPCNGILPQSPMHTRSLATLKRQILKKKMVKSAKECIKMQRSNSEMYGKMHAVFIEMDTFSTFKENSHTPCTIRHCGKGCCCSLLHLIAVSKFSKEYASFVETVPFKFIALFTLFQLVYFLICFGITWIPHSWNIIPTPIFILISIREHLLPKFFPSDHLRELDAAEYEEIAGLPVHTRSLSFKEREDSGDDECLSSQEILDVITTHRGELKLRSVSFTERQYQVYPDNHNLPN